MSRSGIEEKPPWQQVPGSVRAAIEKLLGSPVARAARVWGGYGPTATFRLRLADGRRAFVKGAHPGLLESTRAAIAREERVYAQLGELMGRWAPAYYGSVAVDGWSFLALEDLGPKSAPPWTPRLARAVLRDYAAFHASTLGRDLPAWLPRPNVWAGRGGQSWEWAVGGEEATAIAGLAGADHSQAAAWLRRAAGTLASAARGVYDPAVPWALLHYDTRSDNLRWHAGRLYLLDWPHVVVGPVEMDVVAFAQSITVDGGPPPEELLGWYQHRLELNPAAVDAAVAALAGYFAYQGGQPDIPGLPRLRPFQRQQMKVTLTWAAERLGLPFPAWVEAIQVE